MSSPSATKPASRFLKSGSGRGIAGSALRPERTAHAALVTGRGDAMFFFYSNWLGALGSIAISIVLTLVLLKACSVF